MGISTKQISQELNDHKTSTKLLEGTVERGFRDMRNVIVAIIVVLVVAFITLMITVQGLPQVNGGYQSLITSQLGKVTSNKP
jgi:multisubunit Na+/H+ antiporter MnhB subunit